MSVDVKVSLNGYVDIKEIIDFLNEIGNVEEYKINEKNYKKQCIKFWKEVFCEDKLWKSKFGFINVYYKKEFRTLFYNYNTVNFWDNIECYSEELQKNFVKGEHTQLSLSCYGNAIEIMKLICEHFGGWIDENDCDDIDPYYIDKVDKARYCWSSDGEYYNGSFDTEQEAIEDAKETVNDVCEEVYVGTCEKPALSWNSNKEEIVESIYESLYDQCGEVSESFEITREQELELANRIDKCVERWIKDMKIKPNCFTVVNEHLVKLR